ncbi:MAG TPA: Ig domain-containing protein, partial [Terriglobales bacterium]
GVNLASSGVISGTPSSLDYSAITVTVTDSSQPATSVGKLFYQTFNPPLTVNSGPVKYYDGILNTSYSYPILVSGGIPPYTATVVQGALPEGFSLNAGYMSNMNGTFTVAGVPTVVGNSSFTIKFTDSESPAVSVSQDATLQITTKLTMSSPPTDLGDVIVGQPMSYQFAASGGILPYHWWGNPVQGVNVDNATGLLSGVPEAPFIGSAYVYVSDSSTPPQQAYASPHLHVADVLKLGTSTLPSLRTNSGISFQLIKLGGTGPFTWAVSSGSLPTGLTLSSDGLLSGTVSTAGTYPFSITLSDIGPPAQTATVNYSINVGAPGRNDSIATATPISNGQYSGSISPAVDPVTGLLAPDIDYYKLTADPGSAIIIETFADRLSPASPMDSVLEIVDAGGVRLQYCSPYGGDNPYVYTQDCMSDDLTDNNSRDSRVFIMFPTSLSGPQTFYVKVLDWRGTARPDFQYQLNVSGVD